MTKRHNESGRTMLEMLGVLAIMGVIMYGAIAGIGFGVNMYKINASYNDLQELSQGIIDLYSWTTAYPASTNILDAVESNDILSGAHFQGSVGNFTAIDGQFGSSKMMVAVPLNGNCFGIVYQGIPEIACSRLVHMSYANLVPVQDGSESDDSCNIGCSTNCGSGILCLISR